MTSVETSYLPVLVTGVTGVPGFNFYAWAKSIYPGSIVAIRPTETWRMKGDGIYAIDPEDSSSMQRLFEKYQFKSVLNATGSCALKACELNPDLAMKTNVASADVVSSLCAKFKARLVHISSDLVFSGKCGNGKYLETSEVDPVTNYGKTMVAGEQMVQRNCPSAAILRISLPMGPSFNGHAGAIDWIESRFKKSKPATLYYDEVRSPTYVEDMNKVFEIFLQGDQNGIFHFGGPRYLSLFQIGQIVNKMGGYDPTLLHGCPRMAAGPIPPRAGNVTMISEKLEKVLGFSPFRSWPYSDEFVPQDREWHFHRETSHKFSPSFLKHHLYRHSAIVPEPSDYLVQSRHRSVSMLSPNI